MTEIKASSKPRFWWLPLAFAIVVPLFLVLYTRILSQQQSDFELHNSDLASQPCALLLFAAQGLGEILLSICVLVLSMVTYGMTGRMIIIAIISIMIVCAGVEAGLMINSNVVSCGVGN